MKTLSKVIAVQKLHEHRGTLVTVDGKDIALFRRRDTVCAISNVCAHQHFSMLHQGPVKEFEVTCPMHGWTYDIRTGKSTTGQGNVAVYPVKVTGNDVFVEIED